MRKHALLLALVLVLAAAGCKEGDVLDPQFLLAEPGFVADAPPAGLTDARVTMRQAAASSSFRRSFATSSAPTAWRPRCSPASISCPSAA